MWWGCAIVSTAIGADRGNRVQYLARVLVPSWEVGVGKDQHGPVILGGVLAGVVINIGEFCFNGWLMAAEMEAAMKALGKPMDPAAPAGIGYFVVSAFVLGILAVWLYAAIRPRFGPGPRTAFWAGLAIWTAAYLYVTLGFMGMELFPTNLLALGLLWGFFEVPLATVAGAWLYKE